MSLRKKTAHMVPSAEDECPINDGPNVWYDDMDDVSDDLEASERQPVRRLRGGADKDDEDDEIDDAKPAEAQPTREQPPPPQSKLKKILVFTKIGILLVVWAICTVCLMISRVTIGEPHLLTIPVNAPKNYLAPDIADNKLVGLIIVGPFAVEDDLKTGQNANAQYLTTQVERITYDDANAVKETVVISDVWKLKLLEGGAAIKHIKKSHVFELKAGGAGGADNTDVQVKFTSNIPQMLTVKITVDTSPVDKNVGIIYGALILLGLYVAIVWEVINRTFAAILASTTALAVLGAMNALPSLERIMKWIDVETMVLLFGMMILVAVLSESGVFDYLAVCAYKISRGRIWPLVYCLCFFTASMSSFLDNVTMMLLITPVTIRLCEVTDLNPAPILICMVIYSNIGAALTPVGDPPNILITTNPFIHESGMNFGLFVLHMLPAVILGMISTFFQLRYCKYHKLADMKAKYSPEVEDLMHEIKVWERTAAGISALSSDDQDIRGAVLKKIERLKEQLKEKMSVKVKEPSYEETLRYLEAEYPIRNKPLLYKSGVAFSFVVILFFLHSVPNLLHLSLGWIALLGALMLLILADVDDMQAIMSRIEWSTLLFFAGLFILMECLTELGLIEVVGDFAVKMILAVSPEHRLTLALFIILWITSISSGFLDNIPVTTMMIKIVISLSQNNDLQLPLHPLVWALAIGACFGGNGTLIGASANVVCAGVAEQHGYKISFMEFFLAGFPVVIGSTAMATVYLLIAHVVLQWH